MERRFDATLKSLLEDAPADWPRWLGIDASEVTVIDADISTISGAADKVLRLGGSAPSILHLDFQSGPDASKPCDLNVYNSVLEKRHDLPVRTVLILLSPRAELAVVNGVYQRELPEAVPYRIFRYEMVRVWEVPFASLLAGGLGTLALAPLSAVTAAELPDVLRQMKGRLEQESDRGRIGRLWTAVYVLMGLRYRQTEVEQLLQGVMGMKESVTYQAIVAEGEAKGEAKGARQELRKMLLTLGAERFGEPAPDWAAAALAQMEDLEQLETLATRILRAESWNELLTKPQEPRRRKKGGP